MKNDSMLDWYAKDEFLADEVYRGSTLSERSQRELCKQGILTAAPQEKLSAPRLLSSLMLKRAALIAPFNDHAGLNLKVAGKIVFADTMLESLLFHVIDPKNAADGVARKSPNAARQMQWFDKRIKPQAEGDDYFLGIVNGRYIVQGEAGEFGAYAELNPDRSDIIVHRGAVWDHLIDPLGADSDELLGEFSRSRSLKGSARIFAAKTLDRREKAAIAKAIKSPSSLFTVNASLTLRLALRRLLMIDGAGDE